ncbi:DUF1489 family protein [Pelagibacterium xiamenense]|uniref:DUF1489 family protein n=1 Tax=Pelagibacterium xiamenense TaxID=2901140 RepID=UPI001E4257A7|nr:DUF1489 domain-containing protein [Pelagibacterium xiamenense]MCD7061187.1 DUF1489 domain-containing protein [Pelagibacterium xiamenense]
MHIIKLCVGVSAVDELIAWREHMQAQGLGRADRLNRHRTRMMPKRAEEIAGQGSLYWVIAGAVRCRQKIVALEAAVDEEGRSCCDILMDPEIVRTVPQPRRPFQGWRYLDPKDAPADLAAGENEDLPPEEMAEELARFGLL